MGPFQCQKSRRALVPSSEGETAPRQFSEIVLVAFDESSQSLLMNRPQAFLFSQTVTSMSAPRERLRELSWVLLGVSGVLPTVWESQIVLRRFARIVWRRSPESSTGAFSSLLPLSALLFLYSSSCSGAA